MKICFFFLAWLLLAQPVAAQFWNDFELEPHSYRERELDDPVTGFLERVNHGEIAVDEADGKALVSRLLREFDIPVSSQILVFTKTSLQRDEVDSGNPRALYFNEDVYLGWMPGGRIEIASIDSQVGPVFYFQRPLGRSDDLLFRRTRSCLGCHAGSATNFLPGLLGRSVYPAPDGRPLGSVQSFERIGHSIPYGERWGGWMVTGRGHQDLGHLGNSLARKEAGGPVMNRLTAGVRPGDLGVFFPAGIHLAEGSDVLAMLVHDHQISAHFHLNEAQYRVRQALFDAGLDPGAGREELASLRPADRRDVDGSIDRLLRYFLFAEEPALAGTPLAGHGAYRKDFLEGRRVSASGKSLKDLDLTHRLLRHRLSWMVYSRAFYGLPRALREEFDHRLWRVLTEPGSIPGFTHLDEEERRSIREIYAETQKDLPAYWSTPLAGI